MSNARFYCPHKLAAGALVSLPPTAAIHAVRVLRMQAGDAVTLFNGDGNDYAGEILTIRKDEVSVKLKSGTTPGNESPLEVHLLQAISSGDRMDFTIQKAVELGIRSIQPIMSQRSVVKLSGERVGKRRDHWQNVAISACEQSGRAYVPDVAMPIGLPEWLAANKAPGLRLTLAPGATQTLQAIDKPKEAVWLLIGAEGGLSPAEIELAGLHGFIPVQLGPRILRTETAALAALSAMQALWGDFQQLA